MNLAMVVDRERELERLSREWEQWDGVASDAQADGEFELSMACRAKAHRIEERILELEEVA